MMTSLLIWPEVFMLEVSYFLIKVVFKMMVNI